MILPDAAADMGVNRAQSMDRLRRAEPVMRDPTRHVLADVRHADGDGSPPVWRRYPSYGGPQPLFRLARGEDGDVAAILPANKMDAQEVNIVWLSHITFLLVDLEPHALFQKSLNRCHDTLRAALAPRNVSTTLIHQGSEFGPGSQAFH
jgi:hypothetical protein